MAGGPSSAKSNQETEATPNGTISAQINQVTLLQENVEQADIPPPNKEGGEAIQNEANQGSPSNPSYAEIARKKPVESSISSEDETYERLTKKAGRKSRKEKREEEAERLKIQVKLQ